MDEWRCWVCDSTEGHEPGCRWPELAAKENATLTLDGYWVELTPDP